MKTSFIELVRQGGFLMIPLLIVAIVALIFFFERFLYLHKGQIRTNDFLQGILNLLQKQSLLEALTVCEETPGPIAQIVKTALLNHSYDEHKLRLAIQSTGLTELPFLERRVNSLASIAKLAPMIGLLGTVIALLNGFNAMKILGPYAQASNFSAYVVSALVTTATGLTISILCYMGHHFLTGRIRAIVHDMEWIGNEMMLFISKNLKNNS